MSLVTYNIPPATCFTRNPIRYKIGTDLDLETPGLNILCTVEFRSKPTDAWAQVLGFPLSPDSIGMVETDLGRIAHRLLQYKVPSLSATVQAATTQTGYLRITFTEFSNDLPTGGTPVVLDSVLIVKGGLAYERWQSNVWFENRYPNFKFLTWASTSRTILPWVNDWLSYLHLSADATLVKALITITYTDATTNTVDLNFPNGEALADHIYHIPAGYINLGLAGVDPAKPVHFYTIQILKDDTPISETVTYTLHYDAEYETFHFNFFNSLGGFEGIAITGEHSLQANRDFDLVDINTSRANFGRVQLPGMSQMNRVTEQLSYKANIGVTHQWSLHDLRRELFLSEQILTRRNNRWWPVNVLDKTVDLGPVNAQVKDLPIEWAYAFSNTQYTPETVALGTPSGFQFTTQCPLITYTINGSSIGVAFNHAPAPVERYDLILLNTDDEQIGETITKTIPYTSPIAHTFTGLAFETFYKIRVVMYNLETLETRTCNYSAVTTLEEDVETPPPPPGSYPMLVALANSTDGICSAETTTVYTGDTIITIGTQLFTNEALTIPVSGFNYLLFNGDIYYITENTITFQTLDTC